MPQGGVTEGGDWLTPPPEDGAAGDVMQAYARVWPYVEAAVEYTAREVAKDRDNRKELVQLAKVELWNQDASRCNIRSRDDLDYLRKVLSAFVKKKAAGKRVVVDTPSEIVPDDLKDRLL